MLKAAITAAAVAASLFSTFADAHIVYRGCAVPPDNPPGRLWYFATTTSTHATNLGTFLGPNSPAGWATYFTANPTDTGSAGDAAHPFDNLNMAFSQLTPNPPHNASGWTKPLAAMAPYLHSTANAQGNKGYADYTTYNPSADSTRLWPGDEVVLESGNYGNVAFSPTVTFTSNPIGTFRDYPIFNVDGSVIFNFTGRTIADNFSTVNFVTTGNTKFVWVVADQGATPVLTSASIAGATGFVFRGISIQGQKPNMAYPNLFNIQGNHVTPTADIVLENLNVSNWDTTVPYGNGHNYPSTGGSSDGTAATAFEYASVASGAIITASATAPSGSNILTFPAPVNPISTGWNVSATGIPSGTTVTSVSGASITLSQPTTAAVSGNVVFTNPSAQTVTGTAPSTGSTVLSLASLPTGLAVGWGVTGTGIPSGDLVTAINGLNVTISLGTTSAINGNLTFVNPVVRSTTGTAPSASRTLTLNSLPANGVAFGYAVQGAGFDVGTTVTAVNGLVITLSKNTLAAVNGAVNFLIPSPTTTLNSQVSSGSTALNLVTVPSGVPVGWYAWATGIPNGAITVSAVGANTFTLSGNITASISGNVDFTDARAIAPAGGWTDDDWVAKTTGGINFGGENIAGQPDPNNLQGMNCVSVANSIIRHNTGSNIGFANTTNFVAYHNKLGFSIGDGIDIYADKYGDLIGNIYSDPVKVGGLHPDGFQLGTATIATESSIFGYLRIIGNYITTQTDASDPAPNGLQGINLTDDEWEHLEVSNNIVFVNSCNGIILGQMGYSVVTNNITLYDGSHNAACRAAELVVGYHNRGAGTDSTQAYNYVANNVANIFGRSQNAAVACVDGSIWQNNTAIPAINNNTVIAAPSATCKSGVYTPFSGVGVYDGLTITSSDYRNGSGNQIFKLFNPPLPNSNTSQSLNIPGSIDLHLNSGLSGNILIGTGIGGAMVLPYQFDGAPRAMPPNQGPY